MINPQKRERIYIAAEPDALHWGPVKVGWSRRPDPYSRISEHAVTWPRVELVVAYQLPNWFGWHDLPAESCIREVEETLYLFEGCAAFAFHFSRSFAIERGPGWWRLP